MKVLIVEDQKRLAEFLRRGLTECSYTVVCAGNCREANDALSEGHYDVVVLDLGLPDGNGLELLAQWRRGGFDLPVLILSARDTVQDRIRGLDLGADDYLPKPFSLEELLARVRVLLRRQSGVKQTLLQHREISLDQLGRTVRVGDQAIELTSREYALLETFMHHPGRILARSLICEKIWESHYDIDTNLLDVYMSRLRGKLETAANRPVFKTVRGVGYQLL